MFTSWKIAWYKRQLDSKNETARIAAVHSLGRLIHADMSKLIGSALDDPTPRVRLAALAESMKQDGAARSAALQKLSTDADAEVRGAVARALGSISDKRMLSQLLELMKDADDRVVVVAKETFDRLSAQTKHEVLSWILGRNGGRAELRRGAIGRCIASQDHRSIGLLAQSISDPDPTNRSLAIVSLCSSQWPKEQVAAALGQRNSTGIGLFITGAMKGRTANSGSEVAFIPGALEILRALPIEALDKIIQHSDASVRSIAITLLTTKPPNMVSAILFKVAFDSDKQVRTIAQQALRTIDARTVFAAFRMALSTGAHDHANAVLNWAAVSTDKVLVQLLIDGIDDPDLMVRYSCAAAVEACRHELATTPKIKAMALKRKTEMAKALENARQQRAAMEKKLAELAERSSFAYSSGASDRAVTN